MELEIPVPVETTLRRMGLDPGGVQYLAKSDIGADRRFGESYAVLVDEKLVCFGLEDGKPPAPATILLPDVREARILNLSGAGQLEVLTDKGWKITSYFTPAVADEFGKLARFLDARGRGMPASFDSKQDQEEEVVKKCPTCGFLLDRGGVCPKCLKKGKLIWRLIGLLKPFWFRSSLVLAMVMGSVFIALLPQQLVRILVDEVLKKDPQSVAAHQNDVLHKVLVFIIGLFSSETEAGKSWLIFLVFGLAGISILQAVISIISNRMTTTLGTRLTRDLRDQMFSRLADFGVRYHDRHQVGSLMTRVTTDTEELQSFIAQATQGFLAQILMLIGISVILLSYNWKLSLWVVVPGPFVMIATYKFWKFITPKIHQYYFSRWRINSALNACLSGIRVVKAFAQEGREIQRFANNNERLYTARLNVDNSWHTFFPMVNLLFSLGGFIIWYVGGGKVLLDPASPDYISLGTLMMFIGYTGMFYGPLSALTHISQWLTRFLTAAQRIFEILDEQPEIKEIRDAKSLTSCEGRIEFNHVTFGYAAHSPVVHDLNFKIEPGEMLGIVGHSGAGKTTLINLLCRFYDVNEGAILLDGTDVRNIKKPELRRQIGLVLQEPFLFRGTIAENIAYGKPTATMKEIIRSAKAANAHDFILKFPEGYETRIGERGAGLSGGERQRISIARAILHNPPILVLDEATSSVDTETEKMIQEALRELVRNRTTIAIAHRLSTLSSANRLLVIEHGRIVEAGTHDELMELKGLYYRFVLTQSELSQARTEAATVAA